MTRVKLLTVCVAATAIGAIGFTACDVVFEGSGHAHDPIVNGATESPSQKGHVRVEYKTLNNNVATASGTLVRPDVVLTAAHVLSNSNCNAAQNVSGNTWRTCNFVPRSHQVWLGNVGANPEMLSAKQVFVHPQFAPGNAVSGDIDIAVLKLSPLVTGETAFTSGGAFTKSLYSGSAVSLQNGSTLRLFGYGCENPAWTGCLSWNNTLRYADYQAIDIRNGNYRNRPLTSAFGFRGDSGGPYMMSGSDTEIAGVMKAAVTDDIVISQVFGGAQTPGTPYDHDFVELLNLGPTPVSLSGWSLQHTSDVGFTWSTMNLSGSIPARSYYLIQLAPGTAGGASLPAFDASGALDIGAAAGKVALVRSTVALSGSCPTGSPNYVEDFVGYGPTASCKEGSNPAPAPSTTTAALRDLNGCEDTNDNATNFSVAAPTPRNTASPVAACNYSISVPAERFRDWYNEVLDPNTLASMNEVIGTQDTIPDAVFLKRGCDSPFGGTWICVKTLWSNGGSLTLYTPIPDTIPTKLAFALGDFNDDGIPDLVGHLNHVPFYLTTSWLSGSSFSQLSLPLINLDPIGCASTGGVCYDYDQFNVGDFDGNGVDDLEAVNTSKGYVDVYPGKLNSGLQPGDLYDSFVSALGTDGKFFTVTGVGMDTITFPALKAGVDVPVGQANVDVQIFDGDLGQTNDAPSGGKTCYRFFADPDVDNLPPTDPVTGLPVYLANVDDTFFPDHAWKSLYNGANVSSALNSDGDYYLYTLSVELINGTNCATPSPSTSPTLNAFTLRSNGQLSYNWDFRLQFIAFDAAGSFVPTTGGLSNAQALRDTTYDGKFELFTVLAPFTQSAKFKDADADELNDALEAAGMWGAQDVHAPGVAYGANSAITYEIFGVNSGGSGPYSLGTATNPSGQHGPTPPQDVEQRTFQTLGYQGGRWQWSNVLTENNVHVWFPQDGTSSAYYYFVGGRLYDMNGGLHGSAAKTTNAWADSNPSLIDQYLMIEIGVGRSSVRIYDSSLAIDVLRWQYSPCGEPRPAGELLWLMAELLAAKLNLAHASNLGEELSTAKIYGTFQPVSDAIGVADGSLVICYPDEGARAAMAESASILNAVNRRFTDHRWE